MLAGCSSSTLVSPRHRLRSEASEQFQACHFPAIMSTQRLDLPCNFIRKESSRAQSVRPVGLSVEKPGGEAKTSGCGLKQNIRLPPTPTAIQTPRFEGKRESWEWEKKSRCLKRSCDEGFVSRANKRKKGCGEEEEEDEKEEEEKGHHGLSLGHHSGGFWFQSGVVGGEEESVCFVPSEVRPWLDSVVTEITDFSDKNVVETSQGGGKEASGSSTSSEGGRGGGRGLLLRPPPTSSDYEIGNGSRRPNPNNTAASQAAVAGETEPNNGVELITLLVACVEAVGLKNFAAVNHCIGRLGELASPRGLPVSRLTAYFTEALALRVAWHWPHIFHITPPRDLDRPGGLDDDHNNGTALRLLNQVTPIPKFIQFTSNEILLRVFQGKDRVHIIDFDIKQGLQWPSLFQSLASRANPPSHIRITGIGESKQELLETGDRLAGFAEQLNLAFEFHPVVDRLEDVRLWMLHVKEGESVAVNCMLQMHKVLYDTSGRALVDFLGLIRSTNPIAVVMAEQEAEHDESSLESRLVNSLKYYSAVFDSLDSTLPLDSPVRTKIEEMFAREIRNIIACEGRERLERHASFGKWRKLLMEQGKFRCVGITERELLQSQMLLKMHSMESYKVEKQGEDDGLTLSWEDQPLYTVSAWTPFDIAGSSSSYSQPT
ncbi:PREDICTED: scarecrow-like protein 28 [Ipomoea nil]|uniref:scarecrow-like protein 28 n=1 Tax=Ipomoea nil TaxID=35883 RepID=UPI000901B14F|nr:PREDICTED: scarecrow-like protein 28 [Ipomoea nil]